MSERTVSSGAFSLLVLAFLFHAAADIFGDIKQRRRFKSIESRISLIEARGTQAEATVTNAIQGWSLEFENESLLPSVVHSRTNRAGGNNVIIVERYMIDLKTRMTSIYP